MNCPEARLAMKSLIRSGASPQGAVAEHLLSCEACAEAYEEAVLAHRLRSDVAPPPRDGFVDAVIARAIRDGEAPRARIGRMAAAIAVLGLALGILYGVQQNSSLVDPSAAQHVTLPALEGKTVRVVIDSRSAQSAATVTIELAENLELAGFPHERRIEFQTDLAEGKNLLALPLTLTDAAASHFDVALAYGSTRRNIRVAVYPAPARTQAAPINV